jgi:hypothetical protein
VGGEEEILENCFLKMYLFLFMQINQSHVDKYLSAHLVDLSLRIGLKMRDQRILFFKKNFIHENQMLIKKFLADDSSGGSELEEWGDEEG